MKIYNFSAGPACLPKAVLRQARRELMFYGESGMSVMEMSHRSADYEEIHEKAKADLRKLLSIPDNYHVLFIQGGASMQFSMVPVNLMTEHRRAYYVKTGEFAKKALAEAKKLGGVMVPASSEDRAFAYIPELKKEMFTEPADYVHITQNNTIYGTRYTKLPDTGSVPLVADMSSNILSEVYDVSKFGLIYAGAQKNIGPAGLVIVIIREDLAGHAKDFTPAMLNYKTHIDGESMYNTPPTFGIYIAQLVFEWLKGLGGVPAIQKINEEKAGMLYDFLDNSSIFKGTVVKKDRSLMNVPFILPTEELNKKFIKEAADTGLVNLAGHRSVGGMRASIYNPMPIEGVKALVDFMKKFELENK